MSRPRWVAVAEIARRVTSIAFLLLFVGALAALVDDRLKMLVVVAAVPCMLGAIVWLAADWLAVAASRADR